MANYQIVFSFLGQKFNGSCMQPNQRTVQGSIKTALYDLFQIETKIYMCSRLDKGVHAKAMVANFYLDKDIHPEKLKNALNARLRPDIYLSDCQIVPDSFNSLFSAHHKHYQYVIYTDQKKSIFLNDYAWNLNQALDLNKLNQIKDLFLGEHDFASFATNEMGTTIRTISKIEIIKTKHFIYIDIIGPGFLKNMVRMLVASMVNYALDKISYEQIKEYLLKPSKGKANDLAPAGGLYLIRVFY